MKTLEIISVETQNVTMDALLAAILDLQVLTSSFQHGSQSYMIKDTLIYICAKFHASITM